MQGIWWTYLIANPLGHMLGGRHTVPYRAIQMVVCKAERYQPLSKLYPLRIHSLARRLVGLQSYPHNIGFFLTKNPLPTVDGRNPVDTKKVKPLLRLKLDIFHQEQSHVLGIIMFSIGKSRKYEMVVPLHSLLDLHSFTKPRI